MRVATAWALTGLALSLAACGDDPPPTHPPPPPTTTATTTVDPHGTTTTEVADRSPATLVHATGTIRVDSAPVLEGASLERAQRLDLDAGAEGTIELAS